MSGRRDGSVNGSTPPNRVGGGGSIPASSLFFKGAANSGAARLLVREYHYSHREPTNVQVIGTLHLKESGAAGAAGDTVAACFLSIPPSRWSEQIVELSRLVRVDGWTVPLTMLISLTLKEARARFDLVVSFADVSKDHHGGIYQACSWMYHGLRPAKVDANMIDGKFVPRRTCNSVFGTSSVSKLKEQLGKEDISEHWDQGKHLYWRALAKSGAEKAARLGLVSNSYPKPVVESVAAKMVGTPPAPRVLRGNSTNGGRRDASV